MAAAAAPASPAAAQQSPGSAAAADRLRTLLDLPGDVLAHIACLLDEKGGACERLNLAATCRMLHTASQQEPSWWRQLNVTLHSSSGARRLTAWLAKRRPHIVTLLVRHSQLAAANSMQLPSPPLEGLADFEMRNMLLNRDGLCAVAAHTSLTRLCLGTRWDDDINYLPTTLLNLSRLAVLHLDGAPSNGLQHLNCLTQLLSLDLVSHDASHSSWRQLLPPLRQLTSLSMRTNGLGRLPADVTLLTGLAALQLASFQHPDAWAPVLAAAAGRGQRLTRLILERCGMAVVPAEMASLTALQHLSYSAAGQMAGQAMVGLESLASLPLTHLSLNNCPPLLPAAFSQLGTLQMLSLDGWQANTAPAPAAAAALPLLEHAALQHLVLGGRRLPLPGMGWKRLQTFRHVTRLELHQAHGREWPSYLSGLSALRQLRLDKTYWGSGSWQPLVRLHQLTWMELPLRVHTGASREWVLHTVPPALLQLHLSEADHLPHGLKRHSVLTHLALSNLPVEKLRGQLAGFAARWPALRSVDLGSTAQLQELPRHAALSALSSLALSCSAEQPLPAELAQCTGLHQLQLSNVQHISGGWEHLSRLQQLTALSMHSMQNITMLPPSLAALTGLRRLAVERCGELETGMCHLQRLTRLTYLSLSGFDDSRLPELLFARPGLRITGLHY